MLELIEEMPERRGCRIVVSTHLLPDVDRLCDQVVIMHQGQLRFSGAIETLRSRGVTGRELAVEVKAEAATLVEALRAKGIEATVKAGQQLSVALPESATPRDIIVAARGAGVQVRSLEPERESMEQAFLRVVGQ
jgi:ABC-2 type transport system ATP-binding protein